MQKYDLEARLINFSVAIVNLANRLTKDRTGKYLANQILRSAISAALNYGEAQAAESRRDFIHKLRIILKELRETSIALHIIINTQIFKDL